MSPESNNCSGKAVRTAEKTEVNVGAIAVTITTQPHLRVIVAAPGHHDDRPLEWTDKSPAHHITKGPLLGRVGCRLEDDAVDSMAQTAIGKCWCRLAVYTTSWYSNTRNRSSQITVRSPP